MDAHAEKHLHRKDIAADEEMILVYRVIVGALGAIE